MHAACVMWSTVCAHALPLRRYGNPAIALNCGSMLRDCVRDESLARWGAQRLSHVALLRVNPQGGIQAVTYHDPLGCLMPGRSMHAMTTVWE